MALQSWPNSTSDDDNIDHYNNEDDDEIDETEDDLVDNYRFLTTHCGLLRHSATTSVLNTIQQQQQQQQPKALNNHHHHHPTVPRQHSWATEYDTNDFERSFSSSGHNKRYSTLNDLKNTSGSCSTVSRVPPTIYYEETGEDGNGRGSTFSIVRLFTRMKARLKHDRRYRPQSNHQLLPEEDPQEWIDLTKNVRAVLTKALLPDGGYDALMGRSNTQSKDVYERSNDYRRVPSKEYEENDRITCEIDDEFNTDGNEEYDQIIWEKFLTSPRGYKYRRGGVCKAVDRQQFQGQLTFFYGVANNILIDENLKASGLG